MSAVATALTVSSAIGNGTDRGAYGQVVQSYLRLHVWCRQEALSLNNVARVLGLPIQFTPAAESQAMTNTATMLVGGAVGAATQRWKPSLLQITLPQANAGMISDQLRNGLCGARGSKCGHV